MESSVTIARDCCSTVLVVVHITLPIIVVLSFTRVRSRELPINLIFHSRHGNKRRDYSILSYTLDGSFDGTVENGSGRRDFRSSSLFRQDEIKFVVLDDWRFATVLYFKCEVVLAGITVPFRVVELNP